MLAATQSGNSLCPSLDCSDMANVALYIIFGADPHEGFFSPFLVYNTYVS